MAPMARVLLQNSQAEEVRFDNILSLCEKSKNKFQKAKTESVASVEDDGGQQTSRSAEEAGRSVSDALRKLSDQLGKHDRRRGLHTHAKLSCIIDSSLGPQI